MTPARARDGAELKSLLAQTHLRFAGCSSHEAVDIAVDRGSSGQHMIRLLNQAARFRDECLNEHWSQTLQHARMGIAAGGRISTSCGPTTASGHWYGRSVQGK